MYMAMKQTGAQLSLDDNRGPTILGATMTVTIAALITFSARVYVRIYMIKSVGWDDYIMAIAMILCVVGQIIIFPEVHYGAGRHIGHITPDDFKKGFMLNFVTQPIFFFAISLVKVSFGFFLLRIAVQAFYRRVIIGVMVFMVIYTIGCFLTIVLQCTNLAVQWDASAHGTCWQASTIKVLSYVNSSLNITTDVLFSIVIPIPMLWSLQMNRRQKCSLICILGLGIFATAAAVVKMTFTPNYGRSEDWLWDSSNLTIWTVIESNIGIIAGNLPCLKPLFRTVLGSTHSRGSRKTNTSKYLSDLYGPGTHGVVKNYNALASDRAHNDAFSAHAPRDAYMLTVVDANKDKRTVQSKNSTESVLPLHDPAFAGGITMTTEVTHEVDITSLHSEGNEHGAYLGIAK